MQIFAQKLVPQSRIAVTISRSSSVDYPSSDRGPGKHLQRTNRRQRCWSNSCHQMFVLNRLLKLWLYCRNIWMKCWTIPAFKSTSNYWDYAASFHRSHKRSFRFNVSIIEKQRPDFVASNWRKILHLYIRFEGISCICQDFISKCAGKAWSLRVDRFGLWTRDSKEVKVLFD